LNPSLAALDSRRGGKVSSHQSHQSGRDVDILLVRADGDDDAAAGGPYDPARNWSLVRALLHQGTVQRTFLNARSQRRLKAAASTHPADTGASARIVAAVAALVFPAATARAGGVASGRPVVRVVVQEPELLLCEFTVRLDLAAPARGEGAAEILDRGGVLDDGQIPQ
jgi:hypothetical protein